MRVAVIGATGVIGRAAVTTLVGAGHEVVGLARTPEKAELLRGLGAQPHSTSLLDHAGLVRMFEGADAVVNVATHVPVGRAALRPRAWRTNDRLRTSGVRRVVEAAREARVRRVVQESVSFLYADQGDAWVTEDAPVEITRATEPASVGESRVQDYECGSRVGVVLRFGTIIGDDPLTRFALRSARVGPALGLGDPDSWCHVVHTDDLGAGGAGRAVRAERGLQRRCRAGAAPRRRGRVRQRLGPARGRVRRSAAAPARRRPAGAADPVVAGQLGPADAAQRLASDPGPLRRVLVRAADAQRSAAVTARPDDPAGPRGPDRPPASARPRRPASVRPRSSVAAAGPRVFGDVLPEATADERAEGWSDPEPGAGTEEWLRRQVPPHHG